jgi:hypothetical protein
MCHMQLEGSFDEAMLAFHLVTRLKTVRYFGVLAVCLVKPKLWAATHDFVSVRTSAFKLLNTRPNTLNGVLARRQETACRYVGKPDILHSGG